jgi:uncharacterized protein (DUF433 family)
MKTKLPFSKVISVQTDVMSGTPVFASTRVPVQTLLDYLEAGESIDDFSEGFSYRKSQSGYCISRRS